MHRFRAPRPAAAAFAAFAAFAALACSATLGCAPPRTAGRIELTQTVPAESNLSTLGYRATDDAWLDLARGARERLDLAFFYGSDEAPSTLTPVVDAVKAACARGVRVRAVFERVFLAQYPEIPRALEAAGARVRVVDRARTTGGIVHTKMIAADGARAWVGSANFDWRSLAHIHEVGVLVTSAPLAEAVHRLVDYDVNLADDARPPASSLEATELRWETLDAPQGPARVAFAASPRGWLPDGVPWDFPHLRALIAGAERDLTVEFLSYGVRMRDGRDWRDLDDALREAARRGVKVTLVVSSWAERGKHRGDLEALAAAGVEVRVVTIPEAEAGPIPFARVIHGKVVVADGARCWVGTSNGEGDYFLKSRNGGFFLDSSALCTQLRDTVRALAPAAPLAREPPPR
jgi:phosphatidylserine/phosphatidylglycerophosphate/cardiolipin synthase-like enzyme